MYTEEELAMCAGVAHRQNLWGSMRARYPLLVNLVQGSAIPDTRRMKKLAVKILYTEILFLAKYYDLDPRSLYRGFEEEDKERAALWRLAILLYPYIKQLRFSEAGLGNEIVQEFCLAMCLIEIPLRYEVHYDKDLIDRALDVYTGEKKAWGLLDLIEGFPRPT